jgi:hypothetical protein
MPKSLTICTICTICICASWLLAGCLSSGSSSNSPSPQSGTNKGKSTEPVSEWLDGSQYWKPTKSGQGGLWLPFVWTPALEDKQLDSIGKINLTDISLSLLHVETQKSIQVPLYSVASNPLFKGNNGIVLNSETKHKNFYTHTIAELEPGTYKLANVKFIYTESNSQKPFPVELQIPNPFTSGDTKSPAGDAITILVQKDRVALMPRMVMETLFLQKNGAINPKSEMVLLDQNVVPIDLALSQLGWDKKRSSEVYPGSPEFPRGRVTLTNPSGQPEEVEETVARAGILVDVPCEAKGFLKFIWKRQTTDREFVSVLPLVTDPQKCKGDGKLLATQLLAHEIYFPSGDWILKGTHIVSGKSTQELPKIQTFVSLDAKTQSFLGLTQLSSAFQDTTQEKDLKRPLLVKLLSMPKEHNELRTSTAQFLQPSSSNWKDNFLFLGHVSLLDRKEKTENVWDLQFKRTYQFKALELFENTKYRYNGYTLQKLNQERPKGNVSCVLRVTSSEADAQKVEVLSSEFRKSATERLAQCVLERESVDPLVSLSGIAKINILKGSNSINLKAIDLENSGISEREVSKCLEKKLIDFKFAKKVDASFSGELRFKSE